MGMDVYGRKPKNDLGKYFRANLWYWRPLWMYVEHAHPLIASRVESPQLNDGSGLNSKDSYTLARLLKKDIESGALEKYIEDFHSYLNALPLEDCTYCDENGNLSATISSGATSLVQCNTCKGTKKRESILTWYRMNLNLMKEFQQFLENCGGFEIW